MQGHRLYVEERVVPGRPIELADDRAHYVNRVLRLRKGDALVVFDGSGSEFPARLARNGRQGAVVVPGDGVSRDVESPLPTRLVQGVSRGERMDFVIQKATELGIRRITPVMTRRSVVRLDGERAARRHAHWRRVAAGACEQCGRNRLPEIDPAMPLDTFLAERSDADCRLYLQPGAARRVADVARPAHGVEILIGPEGGLDHEERAMAEDCGYSGLALGPRILRTETAALAALAVLQAAWGDLQA